MRITPRLVQIASLLVAAGYGVACSSSSDTSSFPNGEVDAGSDAQPACGGCGCTTSDTGAPVSLTAAQACDLLASNTQPTATPAVYGPACQAYCPSAPFCEVSPDFATQFAALNADGGTIADAGGELDGSATSDGGASLQCPSQAAPVIVTCGQYGCLGRLTEGFVTPSAAHSIGDRFAAMAFLEAVSVHAFARLERELHAHGASAGLLRDSRRARRDEQRHTAMMMRLARRNGTDARLPDEPIAAPVRSLLDVALENAVEGCVRETYGAVVGLIEGETSPEAAIRKTMRAVAADECRHAELAWAVHAWAMPQLSAAERERVRAAMRVAIDEIAERDAETAALLFNEGSMRLAA
ncbi:MAG: hypothetical protein ABI461_12685 [Polyangiaceae bacterium]